MSLRYARYPGFAHKQVSHQLTKCCSPPIVSPLISSLHQVTECSRHSCSPGTVLRLAVSVVTMVGLAVVAMVPLAPRQGVKLSRGPLLHPLE